MSPSELDAKFIRMSPVSPGEIRGYKNAFIIIIIIIDNLVSKYIRQWLDLPISATLSSIILSKNQFGLSLTLPSTKFLQCQTVLRNALKSSPNDNIRSLWKNTSSGTNIQYDIYRNTKEALKAVQHEHKDRLQNILTSQGSLLSHLFNQNLPQIKKNLVQGAK